MDHLTGKLIDSLIQLLQTPGPDAMLALEICAPVLIEHLHLVRQRAVDRREVQDDLQRAVKAWLGEHPLPVEMQRSLLTAIQRELSQQGQSGPRTGMEVSA